MPSKVEVLVEVTDELTYTSSGREQQVIYVDTGDRYPIRDTIFVNDNQALAAGNYIAKRFYRDPKKYSFVLDLNNLEPAGSRKAA